MNVKLYTLNMILKKMVVLQMLNFDPYFYRPQKKLREGNVFTPVCHSVRGGGGLVQEGGWGYV